MFQTMPSRPSLARVMPAVSLFMGPLRGCSNVQIAVLDGRVAAQLGARAGPDDAALLDDHVPVGEARQGVDVLVDDDDRLALALEALQAGPDLGPDERRQALRRLVEDEELRVRHQRPSDREHLLLAAGELRAEMMVAFFQAREQLVDALERPARRAGAGGRGRDEVLVNGERRKHLPALGHEADAALGDPVWREPGERAALEDDLAAARRHEPHDGVHGRGLAHAVTAQERHDLPGPDRKRDVEQHLRGAVGGLEVRDGQHYSLSPPAGPLRKLRFGAASRRVLALGPGSPSTSLRSVTGVRERAVERFVLIFTPLSRAHAASAECDPGPAQDSAAKRRRTHFAEVPQAGRGVSYAASSP